MEQTCRAFLRLVVHGHYCDQCVDRDSVTVFKAEQTPYLPLLTAEHTYIPPTYIFLPQYHLSMLHKDITTMHTMPFSL